MSKYLIKLYTVSVITCAGTVLVAGAANETIASERPEPPDYRPWTLGIEGGTTGFGAAGSWRFSDHFGLRLGADYLEFSRSGTEIGDLRYDVKVRLLSEPLTFDIYPWKKHSFHISVGMMFNQNQLTGSLSDSGTIIIDGHPFPSPQVIPLSLKIEQQPVDPYLSIGGNFLYFDHAHHWALGGELGVAYTGDPKISLNRSGAPNGPIDAALRREKSNIEDDANLLRWYPVVKLMVTYSF